MGDVLAIPLHLAVHVSGFGFAAGLAAYAAMRREDLPGGWQALAVGAALLATSSLVLGALWADGLAWPLYVRAAGYAAVAFGVVGRLGAAAIAPAIPASSHLVSAVAGGLAAVATLGGVLGRGRQVALLSLGIALMAAGDLAAATQPTLGSVVSLAGAVAGISWLAQRTSRSLASRFVSLFTAVLLLVVLVLASASAVVFDQDLRGDRLDLLAQQAGARATGIESGATGDLAGALELLADARSVPAALLEGRASDALAAELSRFVPSADHLLLTGPGGGVAASYDRSTGGAMGPSATPLAGTPLVEQARQRRAPVDDVVRIELLDTETDSPELLAVAVRPLFPTVDGTERRDQLAGTIVAASRLTRLDRLDDVATATGAEVAVVAGDRLAAATTAEDAAVDADLADVADTAGGRVTELGGRSHFVHVEPIEDTTGRVVGSLVLFEPATVVADLQEVVVRVLFLAAVVGGVVATVLAAGIATGATAPVRRLTEAAEQIAEGDLSVDVSSDRGDEVGRLATAFGGMATALEAREADLRTAAGREATLRQRLESVTSSMEEGLLSLDADGTIGLANPAAARLLDVDEDDLVGRPLGDVLVGTTETGEGWATALGRTADADVRSVRGEVDVPGHRRVTVAATAAPLVTVAGETGRVVVLRDVTAEAEVDRMKDEFVSNAAHELRTPLTAVVGYLATLRRRPDLSAARRRELVDTAVEGADRLRVVVDQLVWFADLEAGRARVSPAPTDLSDLVDQTLDEWRRRFPDRTFRRRLARGLPDVAIDGVWTRRALDELLANAVKFSDDTIVIGASGEDDGRVRLEVRDRGMGIPEERMAEIRTAFQQVDGTATRHHGGLGLGLAIVERILERQEAEMDVASHVGQGTHVALLLPAAP